LRTPSLRPEDYGDCTPRSPNLRRRAGQVSVSPRVFSPSSRGQDDGAPTRSPPTLHLDMRCYIPRPRLPYLVADFFAIFCKRSEFVLPRPDLLIFLMLSLPFYTKPFASPADPRPFFPFRADDCRLSPRFPPKAFMREVLSLPSWFFRTSVGAPLLRSSDAP